MEKNISKSTKWRSAGIYFSSGLLDIIDEKRKHTNRSKYISTILGQYFSKDSGILNSKEKSAIPIDQSFAARDQQVSSA